MISTLRSVRIPHNTVLFDYVATLLFAIALSWWTKVPLVMMTIGLLVLGEILHYVFDIPTNTLRYLRVLS